MSASTLSGKNGHNFLEWPAFIGYCAQVWSHQSGVRPVTPTSGLYIGTHPVYLLHPHYHYMPSAFKQSRAACSHRVRSGDL